ncbi:DUF4214 domain-containing protein, partial [Pseudomonas sp. CCI1.2]|uniref:DUF4214 domain-containing protein n=1 Tax=Pseudomonas sp. CCI1.2 TaxID=3048614 RepID=UPI002B222956
MAGQATLSQIQSLYVAYYGRPADPDGLNFWATIVDANGGDMSVIVKDFGTAPEYQQRYGNLDNNTLVNNLYQQMFGRDAEPGGLDFWVGLLKSGNQSLSQIAETIASLASQIDLQVLGGRVSVANAFTEVLATSPDALAKYASTGGIDAGRDFLNQVTGTTVANLPALIAKAADAVANLPSTSSGDTGGSGGGGGPTAPTVTINHLAGAATYDSGFTVTKDAIVTLTGTVITNFDKTTSGNIDTYTAKTGVFSGTETISVAASLTVDSLTGTASPVTLQHIDTIAPGVTVASVAGVGGFAAGFSVTGNADVVVTVGSNSLGSGTLATDFTKTTAGGLDTYTAKPGAFTGLETISVAASLTDAAGNTGHAIPASLSIDTTAPDVSFTRVDSSGGYAAGFTVTTGASVVVNVNGSNLNSTALTADFTKSTASGVDTYTAKSGVFTGQENVGATASLTDTAGNTGHSVLFGLIIDTTAPDVTISQVDATGSAGAAFAAGFSVIAGATVVVAVNSTELDLSSFADHFSITTADGVDTYTAKT